MTERGLRVTRLGKDLVLFSLPTPRAAHAPAGSSPLTGAEAAVASLAMRGLDNQAIAAARGRSLRTIANQLASVYAKLGISGRRELRALSR